MESPGNEIALGNRNAGATVVHAHNPLVAFTSKVKFHLTSLRRELHSVVDEIGDRLEQEIAIATHNDVRFGGNEEPYSLILGDGLIEIPDLPDEIPQCDMAKSGHPTAVFDLMIRSNAVMMAND